MEILKQLFIEWKLDTWANILEVIGFAISVIVLLVGLFIKSEIKKLKTDVLFDSRIQKHLQNLKNHGSSINNYLNDYNGNINQIKNEFGLCRTELKDLSDKVSNKERKPIRKLISVLNNLQKNNFEVESNLPQSKMILMKRIKRMYSTNIEDVWEVYFKISELIRQMENLKLNKAKSK